MAITRKDFLGAAAGGTVLLLLQGCGGGGDGGETDNTQPGGDGGGGGGGNDDPGAQSCGAGDAAIAGNHGHALSIPAADLTSTSNRTYDITGTADHGHSVTFTPAQLQALGAGQSVMVTSTTDSAHDHVVTARCT
jgi:hypothetical protein